MTTPVTPTGGLASSIVVGGQAVAAAPGGVNGGFITNPLLASDQGLVNAEPLYVDPVGACAPTSGVLQAFGTIFVLQPGQTWTLLPGQTTPTYVNAASPSHRFSVVTW